MRENKLNTIAQKFDSFEMLPSETIDKTKTSFTNILGYPSILHKHYT